MDFIRQFVKDITFEIGQRLIEASESIVTPPAPIVRVPVISGHIVSVGYRVSDGTLEIEFVGSRVYRYADVPFETYMDLMDASSVGRFVNHDIKPWYVCTEMKD